MALPLLFDLRQVLSPVRRDAPLGIAQLHPAGSDLASEIVLHTIFDFEISVFKCYSIWTAFRPYVAEAIRAYREEITLRKQYGHRLVVAHPSYSPTGGSASHVRGTDLCTHPAHDLDHLLLQFLLAGLHPPRIIPLGGSDRFVGQ